MSRSAVALLIVLTAILGYFSMVGVAILTHGELEHDFETPRRMMTTPAESTTVPATSPTGPPAQSAE